MRWNDYGYRPYVPVAQRRRNAERHMAKLATKGKVIKPVRVEGRTIARTFWGKAWCDNLESYMDYANRLPRGRTYVRNGSVVHLDIQPGRVEATVSGSEIYQIAIRISAAAKPKWKKLCGECAGGIGSLVELLQGRFSEHVMAILTRKTTGLFPAPSEIQLTCSCPDWAVMCKHVAAVLYGVGTRLDQSPELLFTLRSVNHEDLITQAATGSDLTADTTSTGPELNEKDLSAVFGIELDEPPSETPLNPPSSVRAAAAKPGRARGIKRGGAAQKRSQSKGAKSAKTNTSRTRSKPATHRTRNGLTGGGVTKTKKK
jgi:uncharacterized Zn finger protein